MRFRREMSHPINDKRSSCGTREQVLAGEPSTHIVVEVWEARNLPLHSSGCVADPFVQVPSPPATRAHVRTRVSSFVRTCASVCPRALVFVLVPHDTLGLLSPRTLGCAWDPLPCVAVLRSCRWARRQCAAAR